MAGTFSTGSIDLDGAAIAGLTLTTSAMMPGDAVTDDVLVSNVGTAQLRYSLSTASTNADAKGLRTVLTLTVKTIDVTTPGTPSATTSTARRSWRPRFSVRARPASAARPRAPRREIATWPRPPARPSASASRCRIGYGGAFRRDHHDHVHVRRGADGEQPVGLVVRGRESRPATLALPLPIRQEQQHAKDLVTLARRVVTVTWVLLVASLIGLVALTHLTTSFVVRGGSMAPAIPVGSLILEERMAPDEVVEGNVITFHTANGASSPTAW